MASRSNTWCALTIIVAIMGGCGLSPLQTPDEFVAGYGIRDSKRSEFSLCYGYGCPEKMKVSLNDEEWRPIRKIFTPASLDAVTERQRIAEAVQSLEILTGKKTGIDSDIGGTFPAAFRKGQMDCEDEAINTNVFLILLQEDNLLKFHRIYGIARRGTFPFGWPHMAATITEIDTENLFVVDSWFFDQGMPVHVVEEKTWSSGWQPSKADFKKYFNR